MGIVHVRSSPLARHLARFGNGAAPTRERGRGRREPAGGGSAGGEHLAQTRARVGSLEARGVGGLVGLELLRLTLGLDTLDANLALGLPADARDYTAASAILADLGLDTVRVLTNNPNKVQQLESHGIHVTERVPLIVGVGPFNSDYLATKRDRMGHQLEQSLAPGSPTT